MDLFPIDREDEDERLGYDADHSDPRQYCRHGTWIGSWWGPDYLCPHCEAGEPEDYEGGFGTATL